MSTLPSRDTDIFFEFTHGYDSKLLRGNDLSPRPQLIQKILVKHGGSEKKLLDVGCGTAYKTLQFANYFQEIIGLEPSQNLLSVAQDNIELHNIANMYLVKGIAEYLPFKTNQFDIVTAILSWWSAKEVNRVLKPDGVFLLECLGPEDKKTLTQFFGKDKKGWRGANLNTNLDELKRQIQDKLSPLFQLIEIHNVAWQTTYCEEGLWLLLNNTKTTVRDFDAINDKENFDRAIMQLKANQKITLTQNRLIIVARK